MRHLIYSSPKQTTLQTHTTRWVAHLQLCLYGCAIKPNNTSPSAPPSSAAPSSSSPNTSFPAVPPTPSHPKCTTHPPVLDDDPHYNVSSYGHHTNVTLTKAPELKTYNEAMASSDAVEWLATYKEEMWTWKDLDIYDIVP